MKARAFFERYRPGVQQLCALNGAELPGHPDVIRFIDRLKKDEARVDVLPPRRASFPGEEAFWFCVMQLEEFAEMTWPGAASEPYVRYLLSDLATAADCLRTLSDLPPGLIVEWCDEDAWEDELDDIDCQWPPEDSVVPACPGAGEDAQPTVSPTHASARTGSGA